MSETTDSAHRAGFTLLMSDWFVRRNSLLYCGATVSSTGVMSFVSQS